MTATRTQVVTVIRSSGEKPGQAPHDAIPASQTTAPCDLIFAKKKADRHEVTIISTPWTLIEENGQLSAENSKGQKVTKTDRPNIWACEGREFLAHSLTDAVAASQSGHIRERARELQRRIVICCRRHGVGNSATTKLPPKAMPTIDWTGGYFDEKKPEFVQELRSVQAEFSDINNIHSSYRSTYFSPPVEFSEAELVA